MPCAAFNPNRISLWFLQDSEGLHNENINIEDEKHTEKKTQPLIGGDISFFVCIVRLNICEGRVALSLRPLDGGVGSFPPVGGEGVNLICTTDVGILLLLFRLISLLMDDVLPFKLSFSNELFLKSGFSFRGCGDLKIETIYNWDVYSLSK